MSTSKTSLSILFSEDRTYISAVTNNQDSKELVFIDSSTEPILELDELNQVNNQARNEILSILSEMDFEPDELYVSLLPDFFVTTNIPFKGNITGEELKDLIELEVKYNFTDENIFNLNCVLSPVFNERSKSEYIKLTLYPKSHEESIAEFLSKFNCKPIIKDSRDNIQNTFAYSYPDFLTKNSFLIGIEKSKIELSYQKDRKLISSIIKNYNDEEELLTLCNEEFQRIKKESEIGLFNIFVYGGRLHSDVFNSIKSLFMDYPVERLNSFRQLTTNLSKREIEYCARTKHIFPGCIGAHFPDLTEHIRLFSDENN